LSVHQIIRKRATSAIYRWNRLLGVGGPVYEGTPADTENGRLWGPAFGRFRLRQVIKCHVRELPVLGHVLAFVAKTRPGAVEQLNPTKCASSIVRNARDLFEVV
jgi:hypothetical protein